ncbi:MAG: hypothetical protein QM680_13450 [Luteolibacter sp.]
MPRQKTDNDWTEYETPWVEETDEAFKYRVESRTDPLNFHTVDLSQRGGHGACTCTFFRIVANPNWRRHGKRIPYAPKRHGVSECIHIRAAWEHFHENVTVPVMKKFEKGIPL